MSFRWTVCNTGLCLQMFCFNIDKCRQEYIGTVEGDFKGFHTELFTHKRYLKDNTITLYLGNEKEL